MSRSTISESLLEAIEQLRPALPSLLEVDYASFVAQLEASLARKDESQVWKVFEQHPAVNERLQEILEQQEEGDIIRGGLGLYGEPQFQMSKSILQLYWCETGLHDVPADLVEGRDAIGNALCPRHGVPMIKAAKKEKEPNQKQV